MSTRLFVGNLSYQTTEDDLRQLFAGVASVASVTLVTERESGRSKGFAFVEMATPEDAQKAISQLNGQSLHDRTIRVDLARPREDRAGGGPGDRGARRGGGGGGRERHNRF
ncbi:MAG: RNA-binding protein [Chloroflexi bacterium]|nr:RNA-binding protein [Chloroflexota bacterium]